MIKNRLVLIDAFALIYRAYYSIPANFTNEEGHPTNAVYGFASAILSAIKDLEPEYMAIGIDMGKSHRHTDFGEYKAHRKPAPDDLKAQVPFVFDVAKALNIPIFGEEGFEGEDIIATIVKKVLGVRGQGLEIIIVTGDMDLLQLVNQNVKVYTIARGSNQAVIYDEILVKSKYGVTPAQFVDLKALKGDASDNIPGVPGIGEKTAAMLIDKFGSLERLYEILNNKLHFLSEIKNLKINNFNEKLKLKIENLPTEILEKTSKELNISKKILSLLIDSRGIAFLSQKLSRITDGAPIDFVLSDAKVHDYDINKAIAIFKRLGFRSLISRLPIIKEAEEKEIDILDIELEEKKKNKDNQQKLF